MAKDRRCLDDQSWEVAAMASAETGMAVYSDREDKGLESRMRSKDSCPVWGEGAGKVPDGNSPTPYSTARPVRGGRMEKCSRSNSPAAYSTSITAARRGTSSPISPGSSCPSACATGLTGSDHRDLVLARGWD